MEVVAGSFIYPAFPHAQILKEPSSFPFLNSSKNAIKFTFVYLAQLEFSRSETQISFCSVLTECVISLRDLMGQ